MANEIHTLNIDNTSYTIQPRVLGPMSTYSNGAQFSASGVVRYDNLIGENPFGSTKSTGYNNAVLSISRYNTDGYTSQLGFSGTGIYGRWFNNATPDAITPWRRFIMDDGVNTLNLDTPNVIIGNVSDGIGRSKLNITSYDLNINNDIVYNKRNNIWVAKDDMGNTVGPYIFTNKKMYYNSSTNILPNASDTAASTLLYEYYVWILESEFERFMNYDMSSPEQFSIAFTEDKENVTSAVAGHGLFTFTTTSAMAAGKPCFIPDEVYSGYSIVKYDNYGQLKCVNNNIFLNSGTNSISLTNAVMPGTSIKSKSININGDSINIQGYGQAVSQTSVINIGNNIKDLHLNTVDNIYIGDHESETNPDLHIASERIYISGGKHFPTIITLGNGLSIGEGYSQSVYTFCDITPPQVGGVQVNIGSNAWRFNGIYSLNSYAENGFFQSSDERLKTFGDNIKVDFDALSKMRKAYFTWNDKPDTTHIGVSAQEVQEIYPEVVTETGGQLSVDYAKLSVVALAAVDELHKKNVELEARLAKLEALLLK